jgi:hypothetical protein
MHSHQLQLPTHITLSIYQQDLSFHTTEAEMQPKLVLQIAKRPHFPKENSMEGYLSPFYILSLSGVKEISESPDLPAHYLAIN